MQRLAVNSKKLVLLVFMQIGLLFLLFKFQRPGAMLNVPFMYEIDKDLRLHQMKKDDNPGKNSEQNTIRTGVILNRENVIQNNRSETFVVPNIVHFVWFGENSKWYFHQFLSVLSAYKNIKPDVIYFHCDNEPVGEWWIATKKRVKTLKITKAVPPKFIYKQKIVFPEHKSDIFRILVLQEMGGIYLDTDVIALKSFDPLREYPFTMGLEYHGEPGRVNNGVIISKPNATFLNVWKLTYESFSSSEWDYHSCVIPYLLRNRYSNILHIEHKTLVYPSGPDRNLIYDAIYDWSNNYSIHLWYRLYQIEHNPESVKMMNTTYGQIARFVLYNSSDLIPVSKSVYY